MVTLLSKWAGFTRRAVALPVTGPRPFDRLPSNVVGLIFGKLSIGDRARSRLVCKSWRDKLFRADFPIKPEPPWLFLPNDSYNQPCSFQSELYFQSRSEEERVYCFEMPKPSWWPWRWCCCGSGGGWLLMAGRPFFGSTGAMIMMLWDPISGATRKLPTLSTLPFFGQMLDDWSRAGVGHRDISSVFTVRAQVFSSSVVVVAVVFVLGRNLEERRLALCSPEDRSWSVLGGVDNDHHEDILFHNGKLYTINAVGDANVVRSPVVVAIQKTEHTVRLSCCVDVGVVMLVLMCDGQESADGLYPVSYNTRRRWTMSNHLVGSATTGELLVVSAVLDLSTYRCGVDCDDQGPIRPHACSNTRGFEVRRLLHENKLEGWCEYEKLTSIGEQCIFLGASGSTSIIGRGGVEKAPPDCILFSIGDAYGVLGIDDKDDDDDDIEFNPEKMYVVHERGVFYVPQDRIETNWLTNLRIQSGSCAAWFTPKLPS